jgi:Outer membrane protein beta-barrel domain
MQMKRILLVLACLASYWSASAQYDYHLNGRYDVPVLGGSTGLVAAGFTTMLKNRDDMEADKRLDLVTMNFSYGAGYEQMWWFQNTIGFGFQVLYWQSGAAYTGLIDSANNITMKAKTSLTYLKIPLLFHFKSYNRYYPDRRVRFNASFGPYIALNTGYSDKTDVYDKDKKLIGGGSITGTTQYSYNPTSGNVNTGSFSKPLYKPLDFGFVVGIGGELRISRRTVLSILLRTDIGITDVENKSKQKFKIFGTIIENDAEPWKGLYAKYTAPNAADIATGWASNRPATKNLSFGAVVTYRKYLRK